jgi:hypothetical protein
VTADSGPTAAGDRAIAAESVSGIASSGDHATINIGVSYEAARSIASDVYWANAQQLGEQAAKVAYARVEELTDKFFATLRARNPEAIRNFAQPGLQRALYRAQEAAAFSESGALNDVLVDVLVERAAHGTDSLEQIVLDEALHTIPKLTVEQVNTLTLIFFLRYVQIVDEDGSVSVDYLRDQLGEHIRHLDPIATRPVELRHMTYAGCLSVGADQAPVGRIFAIRYYGLFSRGVNAHAVSDAMRPAFDTASGKSGILPSPANDDASLRTHLEKVGIPDQFGAVKSLLEVSRLPNIAITNSLAGDDPRLRELFDLWDGTELQNAELTSVGTAIGHANARLQSNLDAPLRVWLSAS